MINPYWKCSYETAINLGPWNYFLTDNPYVWHHFELPCRWVTSQSLKINLTNHRVRASRSIDWGTVMMSSLFWMTQWPRVSVIHSFTYKIIINFNGMMTSNSWLLSKIKLNVGKSINCLNYTKANMPFNHIRFRPHLYKNDGRLAYYY